MFNKKIIYEYFFEYVISTYKLDSTRFNTDKL